MGFGKDHKANTIMDIKHEKLEKDIIHIKYVKVLT